MTIIVNLSIFLAPKLQLRHAEIEFINLGGCEIRGYYQQELCQNVWGRSGGRRVTDKRAQGRGGPDFIIIKDEVTPRPVTLKHPAP